MTNNEAIEILSNLRWSAGSVDRDKIAEALFMAIRALDRPQGKWIYHIDDLFPGESTQECSICHREQLLTYNDDNYCPACGAYMRGEPNE